MVRNIFFFACALLTSCAAEEQIDPPERPDNVSLEAVWRGSEKGGTWGDCGQRSNTELTCYFYTANGSIRTTASYKLCIVRDFQKQDYKSPLGRSPAWLENGGAGWIDTDMVQFVATGKVRIETWDPADSNWRLDEPRTENFIGEFSTLFEKRCVKHLIAEEK